jgi:hypothetical protein
MKPLTRIALLVLLAGALYSTAMAATGNADKWLTTAGLLLDIAGIVQLELSGLFDKIIEQYEAKDDYPGGPPSNTTRQLIDDPERPISTGLRNILFFKRRTGFYLIVFGFVFQLAGAWV